MYSSRFDGKKLVSVLETRSYQLLDLAVELAQRLTVTRVTIPYDDEETNTPDYLPRRRNTVPSTSQEKRIAQVIQEYDAQGWHRTGTETDHASCRWLADQVRECGLNPTLEPYSLSRVDPQLSYIDIDGRRVSGLPMFDGGFTGPEGIDGSVGPLGSEAQIGLVNLGPAGPDDAIVMARRSSGHRAMVAVTRGGRPGLAVRNANSFIAPFGPPVLQVSSEAGLWLAEHVERGSLASLAAVVERTESESSNVVAHLRGRQPDLAPLVVTTPRSGWWNCAGERGGGLACWLEVMRSLNEAGCSRDVLFVATSGHELGLLGIESFLQRRPRLPSETLAWVHFGSSIGAALEPHLRSSASDDELAGLAQDALAGAGAGPVAAAPRGTVVGAESQVATIRGSRCVALAGGHALFHQEADRWPAAVDVEAVAGYARAFTDVALRLTQ